MPQIQSTEIELNGGWQFLREKTTARWLTSWAGPAGEPVDLPHCWNAQDTFQSGVVPYRGFGSYRRRFQLPANSDREGVWTLQSDGFYGTGEVWLNGRSLGKVDGQYLGFSLDCGEHLSWTGDNTLAVRLTNKCRRFVLPGHRNPDFILHGGLTCGVRLVRRPLLRIEERSVAVRTSKRAGGGAVIEVLCSVLDGAVASRPCTVLWRVVDSDGETVSASDETAVELGEVRTSFEAPGCRPWSLREPMLYTAEGVLRCDGEIVDSVSVRFGFRDVEFRAREGLFVNGERVVLQGVNRHEAIPGFGSALPEKLQREDALLIKEMGFNFVRLSHYPQRAAFLDACDELGIFVYAELATWKSVRSGRWLLAALRQLEGLIQRDRNRPCVLFWGIGNESRSRRAYTLLRDKARALDPTRPVTYAENHLHRARLNRTTGISDVWGINYELEEARRACDASRLKAAVVSECLKFDSYGGAPRGDEAREVRHVEALVDTLKRVDEHPFLAGYAIWAFTDYASMRLKQFRRFSGLFDAWRQPKYAACLMRARLCRWPYVFLCGSWGVLDEGVSNRDGSMRTIHVFSNCDAVTLLQEGEVVAELGEVLYQSCEVPFSGGELVARGERGDGTAEHRLTAFGPPKRLLVDVEHGDGAPRDPLRVSLRVADEHGVLVSAWNGEAVVQADGPGRLHTLSPDGVVVITRGEGRTYLTRSGEGTVQLSGRSPGLEPVTVSWSEGGKSP